MSMYAGIRDVAALLGRLGVGAVFLAHGVQKWQVGIGAVSAMITRYGLPLPPATALFLMLMETLGAMAFMVGFALPVLAVGFSVEMVGAILSVHLDHGLLGPGGYELVLALLAGAVGLGFNGGRLSLDYLLVGRRRARNKELQAA